MGAKTMCKWGKSDYDSNKYRKALVDATYYCGKCGRATNDKKGVCKPLKIVQEEKCKDTEKTKKKDK